MVHNPEIIQRFEQTLRRQEKQLEHSMISAVEQGREVAADSALDAADQAVQSYQKEMLFSQSTSGHGSWPWYAWPLSESTRVAMENAFTAARPSV